MARTCAVVAAGRVCVSSSLSAVPAGRRRSSSPRGGRGARVHVDGDSVARAQLLGDRAQVERQRPETGAHRARPGHAVTLALARQACADHLRQPVDQLVVRRNDNNNNPGL